MKHLAAAMLVALASASVAMTAQAPVFRAGTTTIVAVASVKKGNAPVAGLQAADFLLTDSGVRQTVAVASLEEVPLDVSLLVDTSGSTTAALDTMVQSVNQTAALLKPGDRYRVLTIGLSVFHAIGWTQAGQPIPPVRVFPTVGISLVYDGLYVAATHLVEPARRHVIVAMTDGEDACSLITPDQIRALAQRTEAIVYWVRMSGRTAIRAGSAGAACTRPAVASPEALMNLVTTTGGTVRSASAGSDVATRLREALADYRTSYVLSFTPQGVPQTGWHPLNVEVVSGKYDIRTRAGYFGSL